jgi:hypothetical protein
MSHSRSLDPRSLSQALLSRGDRSIVYLFGRPWNLKELTRGMLEQWAHAFADLILLKRGKSAVERGKDMITAEIKVFGEFVRTSKLR